MTDIFPNPSGRGNIEESLRDISGNITSIEQNVAARDPGRFVSVTGPQNRDSMNGDSRLVKNVIDRLTDNEVKTLKLDATVTLVRELVLSPATSTPWTIEKTENAPKKAPELIEEAFLKHRLDLVQDSFFGCIDYGWAPFEVIWGLNDRQKVIPVWFKKLLHEWTDILVYRDTGKFYGFINEPYEFNQTTIVPLAQAFNVNFEVEGTDWYGVSGLRKIKRIQLNWDDVNKAANRFDKKVSGAHWIVYYPVGETKYGSTGTVTDNALIAKDILSKLEANGSTAIPDEIQEFMDDDVNREMKGKWRIELLSPGGNLNAQYTDRLKYLDNLKVRALGLPERSVVEGKFGTKAEADTHAEAGIANIDRKHRLIAKQINQGPLNNALVTNFGPKAKGTVFLQVAPLVDARFSLLRESLSRMLQDGDALEALFNDAFNIRAMLEELNIPLKEGRENPKMEKMEPQMNTFGQDSSEDGNI